MANLDAGLETLRTFVDRFRPVIAAVDALQGVTSIDQAIRERKKAAADAMTKRDALIAQVDAASRELETLRSAQGEEKNAQADAAKTLMEDAQKRADDIIAKANQLAASILDEARSGASAVDIRSADLSTKAKDDLATLQAEAREAEQTRDNAMAEYRDIQAKIDAMRESAKSVLL